MNPLPTRFADVDALEDFMTTPSPALVADLARLEGDLIVLGVGGKMGPTLARLARRAMPGRRVIGVARFTEPGLRQRLEAQGVECIACDLLDRAAIERLPNVADGVRHCVFMAGHKFGASGNPSLTWMMNVGVPAMVARQFPVTRDASPYSPTLDGVGGIPYRYRVRQPPGFERFELDDLSGASMQRCLGIEQQTKHHALRRSAEDGLAPPAAGEIAVLLKQGRQLGRHRDERRKLVDDKRHVWWRFAPEPVEQFIPPRVCHGGEARQEPADLACQRVPLHRRVAVVAHVVDDGPLCDQLPDQTRLAEAAASVHAGQGIAVMSQRAA